MAKMGRPRKEIKKEQFETLCGYQCTEEEICGVLDVSEKTLIKWCKETYGKTFSKVFAEKRMAGRVSLRRKQWKIADSNATMAIFLGKQFLGQSDNPIVDEAETADDGFLKALEGSAESDWSDEE